jgi:hypothetical protein
LELFRREKDRKKTEQTKVAMFEEGVFEEKAVARLKKLPSQEKEPNKDRGDDEKHCFGGGRGSWTGGPSPKPRK